MSNDADGADDGAGATGKQVELPATDGGAVHVELSGGAAEHVDADRLESRYGPSVDVHANTNAGESDVIPASSVADANLGSSIGDNLEFDRIDNEQIQTLRDKRISYDNTVAEWLLKNDDLVPSIRERFAGLILGENGLQVAPKDADDDADKRLHEHMEAVYREDVKPHRVVRRGLDDNFAHAIHVARSTDLAELDLEHLDLYTDGATGERVFVQDAMSYPVVDLGADPDGDGDVEEPDAVDIRTEESAEQALIEGDDVFTVELFENPPLEAVATDIVHKLQLKIFKARKAEVASVGGVYIRVNVPEWLGEDEYDARPDGWTEENDVPDTRLEQEVQVGLDNAMDTLQNYQSATVMSIPPNWEVDTIELPEQGEPFDDLIRGYNKDIARRFLFSLDLIELEQGSELSRDTLFKTLLNTVAGWRRQFLSLFDDFADLIADIHGVDGSVEHSFSSLEEGNAESLIQLLTQAGVLGLSQEEARTIANQITGVNLDATKDAMESDREMAPGGPGSPNDREGSMESFLEEQGGQEQEDRNPPGMQMPGPSDPGEQAATTEASTPPLLAVSATEESAVRDVDGEEDMTLPTTCRMCEERTRMQGNFRCPECHPGTSPEAYDGPMADDGDGGADASAASMEHMTTGTVGGTFSAEELDAAVDALEGLPGVTAVRTAGTHDPGLHILVDRTETDDRVNYPARIEEALEGSPFSTPDVPDVLAADVDVTPTACGTWGEPVAAASFEEGEKVEVDGKRGVVTEIHTEAFTGPDGTEYDPTMDDPVFIVATEDGAVAARTDQLEASDWSTGKDDPTGELANEAEAMVAAVTAALPDDHDPVTHGTLHAGPTDWDYPQSWQDADVPARLILLDAWSSMGGQFDCAGGCCHGTMVRNGMSDRAANQFCASMKDRVLMWEGWRGADVDATVSAAYTFMEGANLREAAHHVRRVVERHAAAEETVEVRRKEAGMFSVLVRDRSGDFVASVLVKGAVDGDGWVVVGNDDLFSRLRTPRTAFTMQGGRVQAAPSESAMDTRHKEVNDAVNMTPGDLRDLKTHPCTAVASQEDDGGDGPEAVIDRVLEVLETPREEWTGDTYDKAGQITNFISRMRGTLEGTENPDDGPYGCPSPAAQSLLHWGYRPDGITLPDADDVDMEE